MFREDLLKGKTIIVTGGGTGLGKAMATRFGELGANLVIASRREQVIQDAAEELRKTGGRRFRPIMRCSGLYQCSGIG